jgi:2-phospho-L-lactate guanylyltransferase
MTCWVVTPIKAPDDCKTRLRAALPDPARRELVARMLRHVVEAAGRTPGVDEVLLIGPSRHGLPAAIRLLDDPGGGLNAALAAALRAAVSAGVERLVIVAADLPQVSEADLAALAGAGTIAIAPDRSGTGTNALSLPLPAAAGFRFRYGEGSFAAHDAEARRLGLPLQVVRSASLGLDIDEPEDLAALPAQ